MNLPLLRNHLDVPVAPFDYNPSAWKQRIPICLIAACGAAIAAYMGLYQWRVIDSVWDPFFDTGRVLDSDVARQMHAWFHIPDAMFGAFAYLGDAVFGLAGSTRRWQYRPWLVILFGIDVIPLGVVSVILVVLQGTVVGYWCTLCLVTAAISLVLIFFAWDEVWACTLYLYRVWKRTGSWSMLWKTFWGIPTPEAHEVAEEMVREGLEKQRAQQQSAPEYQLN